MSPGPVLAEVVELGLGSATGEASRELFEACRSGDLERVRKLVSAENVNGRDTAGRKSTPLHFAAGETHIRRETSDKSLLKLLYTCRGAGKLQNKSHL